MSTHFKKRLKPCRDCGVQPVMEHWASGCPVFAVRCNNPDRPDTCSDAFYFSRTNDLKKTVARWNFYQSIPWLHDMATFDWLDCHMEELGNIESASIDLLTEAITYCRAIDDNPIAEEIVKRAGCSAEFGRASTEQKGKILRDAAKTFGVMLF